MFKVLTIFILGLSIFFESYSQAQYYFDPADFDSVAYKKTLELCSEIRNEKGRAFNWKMTDLVKTGIHSGFHIFGEDALKTSKTTEDLLNSPGYQAALDDCYGEENSSKDAYYHQKAFTACVLSADWGGH